MYIGGGLLPFASPAGTAASDLRTPNPSRLEAGGTSAPHPGRLEADGASAHATGTGTVAGATSGAPRRVFEVKMLLCCLPEMLRVLLAPCLLTLAGTRPPLSDEQAWRGWSSLVWRRFSDSEFQADDLRWLRARLVEEVTLGLALAETPMGWCVRPVRNLRLALRAARIAQLVEGLRGHPAALPITDELYHALRAVQRRS